MVRIRLVILFLGAVHLKYIGDETVKEGAHVVFPKNLIHKIQSAEDMTLTINCVFGNEGQFDLFPSGKENAEPEVERGALEGKENQEQLEAIQKILSDWLCSDKKI